MVSLYSCFYCTGCRKMNFLGPLHSTCKLAKLFDYLLCSFGKARSAIGSKYMVRSSGPKMASQKFMTYCELHCPKMESKEADHAIVSLTVSFLEIYFHWSQIQSVHVWNIVVQYTNSSHTCNSNKVIPGHLFPLKSNPTCIYMEHCCPIHVFKTCIIINASEKTGRSTKQGHFGWKQSDWSS